MKQALYAVFSRENLTLKSWFVGRVRAYLREHAHPSVLLAADQLQSTALDEDR